MKQDFYQKKMDLHKEIVEAIKSLMNQEGYEELELTDGCDTAYATICVDTIVPPTEVEIKRVWLNGSTLMADTDHDYQDVVDLEDVSEVFLCSIDTVYESVYQVLKGNE